tara:strand:+ start:17541 stop:18227 length:687 start_codon:yes stop_codon:yes gene_type:complete
MGSLCFKSTYKHYTRNELMALNRDAKLYGINLERYNEFCNSQNYQLAILHLSHGGDEVTGSGNLDISYINAWNKWKRYQSWGINCCDLDKNIITSLAHAPTKMNGYSNIPKKHISWQRESLKRFYKIQDWRKEINGIEDQSNYNALLDIDNYVDYCLDNKRYNDIVDIIKTNYGKLLWDLSQDDKWLKIVEKINCATHRDIKYIEALENICRGKQDDLFSVLDQKIFI